MTPRELADAILTDLRAEQANVIANPSPDKDADQGYVAGLGYAAFVVGERLGAAAPPPPPACSCRHPYGEHDGWSFGKVARKDWTPRWGGACSHEVDPRHTCACPSYQAPA